VKTGVERIDLDYANSDKEKLEYFMLHDHLDLPTVQTAKIVTFNTIALKGAIRDIGRGLGMPLSEVDEISKAVHDVSEEENKVTTIDDSYREKYPELFKYVDLVTGVITSIGSHPSGVLVTDRKIAEDIGFCTLKDCDYIVSQLNMKELDSLNYTKYDVLG
jgi:DNA polymerase-3 subunit alpha